MATNFYYVYALKDPRQNPAMPFYIGKGTGSRASDHIIRPDNSKKYQTIVEIKKSGKEPIVDIMVEDLTEAQALRLESELIAAFGTLQTGGLLTNSIVPTGLGGKHRDEIVVPQGAIERAQMGLDFLKVTIHGLLRANPHGLTNADVASMLGLRSDHQGSQKDYLSYSILGLLMREGKIKKVPGTPSAKYYVTT